ncbi:copper amine oxidase N-terminal domain protein [Peptoniphilus harei ACS-146-V-Sch2b]|uniref:Copper amine oxidase N-terminal domain protein n=1 Tax=Peptoniphilus harei ACS-146-V-Sch2b TaxID=908338 RepID=E4KZE3_9FIRM|nr:copper amine oxidase N-terminal domain-containing protein [Peptoniphilus harei]EFR32757.1 copper amine oxidase N-terminal domain protein [Peptoniphilus harei ACS-146-V-Sch2b]MDU7531829.1 copper amine oxidase N-terminal domain-containing protein [Peptoniphilus harei]
MKKSKRIISFFLSLLILLSTINVFAVRHPVKDIPLNGIIVNDHIVYSDVYPYIKNSRTYVPIRFIAEELGYDVKWDGANKKVIMKNGNTNVELTIGSNKMKVNGKVLTLDAPAEIKDERTFVPLRAIAESFGQKVDYSKDYKAVYIGDNPVYNKNYKVVYYYEGANPVITDYTVNIVTYRVTGQNGQIIQNCNSIASLLTVIFNDFDSYRTSGRSQLGNITTYKTLNTSSSNKTTVNTNNPVRINKIEDLANSNKSSNNQKEVYYVIDDYKNSKGKSYYTIVDLKNSKGKLYGTMIDGKEYMHFDIVDAYDNIIAYNLVDPDGGELGYIRYLDGTIKPVYSWKESCEEADKIIKAANSGNPIKGVEDSNRRVLKSKPTYYRSDEPSVGSYNLSNDKKSYVDYLRSKNTDASDVL